MEKKNKIFLLNLFIVTIIFLIDRLCKLYVINLYEDISNQQIFLTSFLNVYLIWNEGIAFGLLSFESLTIYNIVTFLIVLINILSPYLIYFCTYSKFTLGMLYEFPINILYKKYTLNTFNQTKR